MVSIKILSGSLVNRITTISYKNIYGLTTAPKQLLAPYIVFSETNEPLLNEFKDDLEKYKVDDGVSNILLTILNDHINKFYINFYESTELNCYLIFIVGKNDNILISLGKQYQFPRGFPIIWKPGQNLNMYGFYPKFDNDKMENEEYNGSELKSGIEINFNFKYSGFLGQVIPFTINGKNYWTTAGKNATNYKFSKIVQDLMSPIITTEFLKVLCDNKYHICCETLSQYDQMHGDAVTNEGLVTTLVAKGHWVSPRTIEGCRTGFIETLSQENMHTFCMRHNLLVDNIYKVRTYDSLFQFMNNLNNIRNLMTLTKFNEFWERFTSNPEHKNNSQIIKENISHNNYLGDILEGLIIKITKENGNKETVKYKFPYYTCRTMLFREFLSSNNYVNTTNILNNLFLEESNLFIDRWVVKIPNQLSYWKFILTYLSYYFKTYNDAYNRYVKPLKKDDSKIIAQHIYIMDLLMQNSEIIYDDTINYSSKYEDILSVVTERNDKISSIVPIILSIGSVGSGKTTTSTRLMLRDPNKFQHIDGDVLDLTPELVESLGNERNEYTTYKIVESIKNSKIPIVSIGGGQILAGRRDKIKVTLFKYLNNIYLGQIKTIPIIILPVKTDLTCEILHGDKLMRFIYDFNQEKGYYKMIKQIYEDKSIFDKAYVQRIGKIPDKKDTDFNNYTKWFKISKGNFENMVQIIKLLNTKIQKIILSPVINKDIYDIPELKPIIEGNIFNDINRYELINRVTESPITVPVFKQKRLLVEYILDGKLCMHHVTLKYDKKCRILFDPEHNYLLGTTIMKSTLMVCPDKKSIDKLGKIRSLILRLGFSDPIFNSLKDTLPKGLESLTSETTMILKIHQFSYMK